MQIDWESSLGEGSAIALTAFAEADQDQTPAIADSVVAGAGVADFGAIVVVVEVVSTPCESALVGWAAIARSRSFSVRRATWRARWGSMTGPPVSTACGCEWAAS